MPIDLTQTSSFDYFLPQELIAQDPVEPRDSARLLVIRKGTKSFEHNIFRDIKDYLRPGDLLVLNDTRVLPARVEGIKKYGGAKTEVFFLRADQQTANKWTALVKPGHKLPVNSIVSINDKIDIIIGEKLEDGIRNIYFPMGCDPLEIIHEYGTTPLPHYITDSHSDAEEYQTVYSKIEKENSVASPTAGLHFTQELLDEISEMGIDKTFITLQVGLGTFRPVKTDDISKHIMHSEICEIGNESAEKIFRAKCEKRRVVAVGTTVVRTLETFAETYGTIKPGVLDTNLFIRPGFKFKVVDALITNFHLPKSTLLMLVAAFAGYDTIMDAYREAVRNKYRFFSFGDATFIY